MPVHRGQQPGLGAVGGSLAGLAQHELDNTRRRSESMGLDLARRQTGRSLRLAANIAPKVIRRDPNVFSDRHLNPENHGASCCPRHEHSLVTARCTDQDLPRTR